MRKNRQALRIMGISAMVFILSLGNYLRLTGSDCIRAIHVVTLLTCGAAIGIFIMNFFTWLKKSGPAG